MKVSELAEEFNTTNKAVLDKLRSLKLKAQDGQQELSKAVAIVVRGALKKEKALPRRGQRRASGESPTKPATETAEEAKAAAKGKTTKAEKAATAKPKTAAKSTKKKASPAKTEDPVAAIPSDEKPDKKSEAAPVSEKPDQAAEAAKKPRPKFSDAPFVPLKPLAKKKRRSTGRDGRTTDMAKSAEPSAESTGPAKPLTEEEIQSLPPLELKVPISVKDLSVALQQKTSAVLKRLIGMGVFANINQSLDEPLVRTLAADFGFNLTKLKTQEQQIIAQHQQEEDDPAKLQSRAPVVTFMGHVDHGKTSLLDKIRQSQITEHEHGGITQHIGAYSVKLPKGKITFLDTPGHEAFTAMRARGAHITDLVVLVVAADEGVMPQTKEAIDHARAANVPIVVAMNKMDRPNADPDRVKKELAKEDLAPEDWGGKTVVAGVSAVTGEGIDSLLEMILLESELLELKANPDKAATGIVVEAHLSPGKGAVSSLIVQSGTLRLNDIIVVGPYYGKVKAMFDDRERPIPEAGPCTPVEILGLSSVPDPGDLFYVVEDERTAKEITDRRQAELKRERMNVSSRVTLEDLYSQIQEGKIQELNVILKADVQGSLEALKDSLQKIPSDEVKIKFIHMGVGDVNASDVILAVASNAIIIAFHVATGPRAAQELEKYPVDLRQYRIIYDAVNDMRKALEGMLAPHQKRKFLARIEVRQVFKLSKSGNVAGCYVQKGKVHRKSQVDVIREGEVVHTGKISSLKRFKDDVKDVGEGYECGIALEHFDKLQAGDQLEAFEIESIARTL